MKFLRSKPLAMMQHRRNPASSIVSCAMNCGDWASSKRRCLRHLSSLRTRNCQFNPPSKAMELSVQPIRYGRPAKPWSRTIMRGDHGQIIEPRPAPRPQPVRQRTPEERVRNTAARISGNMMEKGPAGRGAVRRMAEGLSAMADFLEDFEQRPNDKGAVEAYRRAVHEFADGYYKLLGK